MDKTRPVAAAAVVKLVMMVVFYTCLLLRLKAFPWKPQNCNVIWRDPTRNYLYYPVTRAVVL